MKHYFTKKPEIPLRFRELQGIIRGKELVFTTGTGVFAKKRLDKGGLLLANESIIKKGWKVLDLGCGYGMVGIAIAKALPSAEVILVDINERAVNLARNNAKRNQVKITVKQSDVLSNVKETFDTILLNPPVKAGNELCFRMIEESKNNLKKNGLLQVVARHRRGGKAFRTYMEEVFGNVETLARGSGFQVYVSKK